MKDLPKIYETGKSKEVKMREIKFRAWDKTNQVIVEDSKLGETFYDRCIVCDPDGTKYEEQGYFVMLCGNVECENFALMQYTGLKDKNGKEIYEGDLLVGFGDTGLFPVSWNGKDASFMAVKKSAFIDSSVWDKREVIGNIYENKELLNEAK